MKIYRTELYLRRVKKLFSKKQLDEIDNEIALNPESGSVIAGLKGLRKLRVAASGRGKRGGARVIYFLQFSADSAYLLTAYAKNVQEDLSPQEKKVLMAMAEYIEGENDDRQ